MHYDLMDLLACPICKCEELELHVFLEKEEIVEGMITCTKCDRFYPIKDTIPHMLPDHLRKEKEEVNFLKKYENQIPVKIKESGKPYNLK